MADTKKLRSDIQKLKKALQAKGVSKTVKDKLQGQLDKAESELAASKKPAKSAKPKKSTPLNRLQSLVKKKKYSAYSKAGIDLQKDAGQPALPTGKRTSKSGKTYYEYRANRIDVKQPPKRYPKLEDGGYMAKGGEMTAWKLPISYTKDKQVVYGEPKILKKGSEKELIKWLDKEQYEKNNKEIFDGRSGVVMFPSDVSLEKVKKYHRYAYADGGYMADGGEEPTYDSAGFTRQDDSRIIIKSGNNGKLKEIFNEYKNQKNELKANEVFDNEKMNGKSVFLFVNDELYDQYIQESDEEDYADGGMMAEGGFFDKKEDVVFKFQEGEKIKVLQYSGGKLKPLEATIYKQYAAEQPDGTYYPFYWTVGSWEDFEEGKKHPSLYAEDELIDRHKNKPKMADGGMMARGGKEKYNLSFNYNPSNLSNKDAEKIVSRYTKNWKHDNDLDEVSFFVMGLNKADADSLAKELKMENTYNLEIEKSKYADGGMMAKGGEIYKIQQKFKYDLQPKWEDEKFQTGGKYFLSFKEAQDFKKKLQGLSSSMEYKVVKVEEKMADGGMMAKGGYVAVSEKDGYWYIVSRPTTKETAQKIADNQNKSFGYSYKGEVNKVVTVEEAKAHKKLIGEEYLADGGGIPEGYHKMPDGTIMADSAHMEKGGQVVNYRIIPYKRLEVANSPDLLEPYYSLAFTISGTLSEANEAAQKFVKTNEQIISATVTKIHPSGQPLKNKKVSYVTKDEIQKFEEGGYMADGGLTKEKLMDIEEEFEENEDDNYHSENVVLLARYFGTKEDLKEARSILKKHKEEGYLSGDNYKKRYELSMKLFDKWDEAKKEAGIMAKGGEVKVGDIITANTGVKVKVVEYDPKFGGRVKVMRMDEYGTGEPSQFMRLSKFKYGMGGYMAEGGVMSTTHRLSK